ncbi:interleukin-13 receptor subunit alpha-1-like isoform X2 [Stegostoma tigrinum]|uniref:interleukin-13 receptor subunit alpha-1-like isoform X2 n=1 Tax=Stegostoma tigrinum TaxID=3053191 RepID=UPI00202B5023|nr:interleukin-13 receptor subunit alpha-1-like isoform X2 [Stegostoma tigrinum]
MFQSGCAGTPTVLFFSSHHSIMLLVPSLLIIAILRTTALNETALTSLAHMSNGISSIHNLPCIFHDYRQMTCTWDISKQARADAQYRLSYGISGEQIDEYGTIFCENGWRNVTCHVQDVGFVLFNEVQICITELGQNFTKPYCIEFTPVMYYKVSPPVNIVVKENEVIWDEPEGKHPSSEFYYQIQITDQSTHITKIENVTFKKWNIENRKKSYSVKVRARINNHLEFSIWSDWTEAVIVEAEPKDYQMLIMIVLVIAFIVLVLLVTFTCKKSLDKLCQPIPDPKRKFKGLFDNNNGNFQEWIDAKHLVTKIPEECITVAVED